jgi:hypothetical protein
MRRMTILLGLTGLHGQSRRSGEAQGTAQEREQSQLSKHPVSNLVAEARNKSCSKKTPLLFLFLPLFFFLDSDSGQLVVQHVDFLILSLWGNPNFFTQGERELLQ